MVSSLPSILSDMWQTIFMVSSQKSQMTKHTRKYSVLTGIMGSYLGQLSPGLIDHPKKIYMPA